jgi:hypothetical protein
MEIYRVIVSLWQNRPYFNNRNQWFKSVILFLEMIILKTSSVESKHLLY